VEGYFKNRQMESSHAIAWQTDLKMEMHGFQPVLNLGSAPGEYVMLTAF
jgi:hypothetical protein